MSVDVKARSNYFKACGRCFFMQIYGLYTIGIGLILLVSAFDSWYVKWAANGVYFCIVVAVAIYTQRELNSLHRLFVSKSAMN